MEKLSLFILINYLLLFGAGILWGSQYFFTKLALESFSAPAIAVGRISIGAIVLTILLATGVKTSACSNRQQRSFWSCFPDFILIGLLEGTIPCVFVGWAQREIASSVTAILIGSVPLFTILLEALFMKENRLTAKKVAGVILGFFGIVVLLRVGLDIMSSSSAEGHFMLVPVLAVLTSALCFAISMLLIKVRLGSSLAPIRSTQGILLGALVTLLPLSFWLTKPWMITSFHCSFSALMGVVLLGIFCSGSAYTLFVILINRAGPTVASMTNYLVPPIGAFIGITFSGEKLTTSLIYSLLLILFALWLASSQQKEKA
ncbi:MAG: DMT family transporter [Chthoniobacterales bacterium]